MTAQTAATKFSVQFIGAIVWLLLMALVALAGILSYGRSHGYELLSVQTGSMQPAINPGDAVLVKRQIVSIKPGSVVTYHSLQNPTVIISHRVVSYNPATSVIVTKGDALKQPDPGFGTDRLIGTASRTIPHAGYVLDLMRHPIGLLFAVYIPAVILAGSEIRRLMQYYETTHYRLHNYLFY